MKPVVLLLATLLVATGCRFGAAPSSALTIGEEGKWPLTAASVPTLTLFTPGEPSLCPSPTRQAIPPPVRLPGSARYALLTVTQHAHTTLVALDARGAMSLAEPQVMGEVQLSAEGHVLAYEILEDINPLNNTIVVADLTTGTAWRVVSGDGCAVLGFALDATGERLALLQVAMRGRFKPATWQVSVLDLASGSASALGPAQPEEVALEPIAWSNATHEIVLRGFVPFQADGAAGWWAVRADGSRPRPLLSEADYVGRPRLSPDGRRMAFFTSEPENLPGERVVGLGEPLANALRVLDLVTGETQTLATDVGHVFGTLAWGAAGERLYLTRGAWPAAEHIPSTLRQAQEDVGSGHRFQFDEILSLSVGARQVGMEVHQHKNLLSNLPRPYSTPEVVTRAPESVVGLKACAGGGLVYVTAQGQGARVRWSGRDAPGHAEWGMENGAVEILACH